MPADHDRYSRPLGMLCIVTTAQPCLMLLSVHYPALTMTCSWVHKQDTEGQPDAAESSPRPAASEQDADAEQGTQQQSQSGENVEQLRHLVASLRVGTDFAKALSQALAVLGNLLGSATLSDVQVGGCCRCVHTYACSFCMCVPVWRLSGHTEGSRSTLLYATAKSSARQVPHQIFHLHASPPRRCRTDADVLLAQCAGDAVDGHHLSAVPGDRGRGSASAYAAAHVCTRTRCAKHSTMCLLQLSMLECLILLCDAAIL